jgi:hypothetical protein
LKWFPGFDIKKTHVFSHDKEEFRSDISIYIMSYDLAAKLATKI